MKKILLATACLALLFGACALNNDQGKLRIDIPPATAAARAGETGTEYARISLYRYGAAVRIGTDTMYQEVPVSGTRSSIEIKDLAAGQGYRIAISIGSKPGTTFHASSWAMSDSFEIAGGISTPVSLRLATSPFSYVSDAAYPAVAVVHATEGGGAYLVDNNQLKQITSASPFTTTTLIGNLGTALGGATVNNLVSAYRFVNTSAASSNSFAENLWILTNRGIFPYDGTLRTDFMSSLATKPNVKYAVAFYTQKSGAKSRLTGLYSSGGAEIGAMGTDDPAKFPWQSMTDAINGANLGSLGDMLKGSSDVLKSLSFGPLGSWGPNFYFIATSLNLFRIDAATMTSFPDNPEVGVVSQWATRLLNDSANVVSVDGGATVNLVSSAVASASCAWVFAGTDQGLYASAIDPTTGKPVTSLRLVGSSTSERIVSLNSCASSKTGAVYTAATTNLGKLYIFQNGSLRASYEAAAGIPQGTPTVTWWDTGTNLVLFLGGSDGLVQTTITP